MKVGIVLPWRGSKTRTAGFEASLERHKWLFPDAAIYKSDSIGSRFNPSEARNRGCLEAIADGCEVLVVLDADTLFMPSSIEEAIKIATTKNTVCYAYTIATELGITETNGYLAGTFNPFGVEGLGAGHPIPEHVGSGWVLTPETFTKMNGWDENFLGWGWEDNAFQETHRKLFGTPMKRASGVCFRLFHEERDMQTLDDNHARFALYNDATSETIKDLISNNLVHLAGEEDES